MDGKRERSFSKIWKVQERTFNTGFKFVGKECNLYIPFLGVGADYAKDFAMKTFQIFFSPPHPPPFPSKTKPKKIFLSFLNEKSLHNHESGPKMYLIWIKSPNSISRQNHLQCITFHLRCAYKLPMQNKDNTTPSGIKPKRGTFAVKCSKYVFSHSTPGNLLLIPPLLHTQTFY